MNKIKCIVVGLVISICLQLTPTPAQASDFPPIWVWPSGCISIDHALRETDPYPWWFVQYPGITYRDRFGILRRMLAYRIKPIPYNNEFVGAADEPGFGLLWLAPAGTPNQLNRSINCMLSNGGTQG